MDKVGNAKAYEMLSCLNGALEFYRTTGEKQLLEAALNAWQDIVDKRLYLTALPVIMNTFTTTMNFQMAMPMLAKPV